MPKPRRNGRKEKPQFGRVECRRHEFFHNRGFFIFNADPGTLRLVKLARISYNHNSGLFVGSGLRDGRLVTYDLLPEDYIYVGEDAAVEGKTPQQVSGHEDVNAESHEGEVQGDAQEAA